MSLLGFACMSLLGFACMSFLGFACMQILWFAGMNVGKEDWDCLEVTKSPSLEILVDSSSFPNEAAS